MGDVGKWFLDGSRRGAEEKGDAEEKRDGDFLTPHPVIPGLTRDLASCSLRGFDEKSQAPDQVRGDGWGVGI